MADYNISEEWKEDEDQNVTDETNLITDSHTSSNELRYEQPWFTGTCKVRALVAFWIFGLTNNFGYVVMLSAANDILQPNEQEIAKCKWNATTQSPHELICNPTGTGSILLADILPTLFIKFTAPFYMHRISYNLRVMVVVLFNASSFIIVALAGSQIKWLSYIGVACGSVSSGFGEITFLSMSSYYAANAISTWSSGTGAAGIFGAISYAGLTQLGLSANTSLLIMLVVPLSMALSYYLLIVRPPYIHNSWSLWSFNKINQYQELSADSQTDSNRRTTPKNDYTLLQMIKLIQPLLKFMVPLMIVYMAEYFINQALFELLYFSAACSWLSIEAQYRWYQTIYQVGVFISRSSVNCFTFKHLWILPLLQIVNLTILTNQVIYHYMPESHGIWIVFALILFEGCLGGLGYVQTFYQISHQVKDEHREFSLGIASVADSTGITITAFLSILAHNNICGLGITWK